VLLRVTFSFALFRFTMPMASDAAAVEYFEPSVAAMMLLNSTCAARGTTINAVSLLPQRFASRIASGWLPR
jgi:hypothetical protein